MSQRQKLLERAKRGGELNGEDFRTLARGWGIEVVSPPGGGSHFALYLAKGKKVGTVKIPGSGRVKRCYVTTLLELIEEGRCEAKEEMGVQREGVDGDEEDEDR